MKNKWNLSGSAKLEIKLCRLKNIEKEHATQLHERIATTPALPGTTNNLLIVIWKNHGPASCATHPCRKQRE
jgi:hypothetical protein